MSRMLLLSQHPEDSTCQDLQCLFWKGQPGCFCRIGKRGAISALPASLSLKPPEL